MVPGPYNYLPNVWCRWLRKPGATFVLMCMVHTTVRKKQILHAGISSTIPKSTAAANRELCEISGFA